MSTWEDRMAARAAARTEERWSAEAARRAEECARRVAEAGPSLPGEDPDPIEDGPHAGHYIHDCGGISVVCQCGVTMGVGSFVVDESWRPEPCPVCAARGISLGGR